MSDFPLAFRQLRRAPGFALVATPLLLLAVAARAVWMPVRRATRVPPTEALRAE